MKTIIIKTKEDENKFFRRLWLYRSILYRFTKFKIINKTKCDQYKYIEEALNIKSRIKRFTYIYDTTCKYIDDYNDKHHIACVFDKMGVCKYFKGTGKKNACCRLCPYQSDKGCVSSNLSCKLFFCYKACEELNPLTVKDLKMLYVLPFRERKMCDSNFFCNRKTFLICLISGSYIVYTLVALKKLVYMLYFILKKNRSK